MNLSYLAPVGSVIALLFAAYLARGVLKSDPGSREMVRISMAAVSYTHLTLPTNSLV